MKSGWGALAGPVIAAAVILAPNTIIDGVPDSKLDMVFERHKGDATAAHLVALSQLGPLLLHRRSCTP
jgi:ribonuclease HII